MGGGAAVEFLIAHFNLFGFDGQNWMLIVAGLIAAFVLFAWKTRDRV
jgi:H+/gluconate symporter-like permease